MSDSSSGDDAPAQHAPIKNIAKKLREEGKIMQASYLLYSSLLFKKSLCSFPTDLWLWVFISHIICLTGSGVAYLEWLKNALDQIAEDRNEDNDFEPIPLVPITEQQEDAMENKTFQGLLKKIGVKPPADEQVRGPKFHSGWKSS